MTELSAPVLMVLDSAHLEETLKTLQLPFQPQVLTAVLQLRDDTRMDFTELDRLIRSDQTIASLILKLANSSFYSRGKEHFSLGQLCPVQKVCLATLAGNGDHRQDDMRQAALEIYSRRGVYRWPLARHWQGYSQPTRS